MSNSATLQNAVPTADELVARAAAMLRERSATAEEIRQVPRETVDDFIAAGIMRVAVPKRFGGYNYGVDTITQIAVQVGRGCGLSAWMAGQWGGPTAGSTSFSSGDARRAQSGARPCGAYFQANNIHQSNRPLVTQI